MRNGAFDVSDKVLTTVGARGLSFDEPISSAICMVVVGAGEAYEGLLPVCFEFVEADGAYGARGVGTVGNVGF